MPEHQSDIFVIFTMTIEILLEPTSSKLLVMAAPVISISSNVSVESVGSSFPRVIHIGSIFVEVLVASEVGATAIALQAGVLKLVTHSSSKADPSESSPPPVSVAPMVLPFLCSDDLESDTEIPERHASPTTSTLEIYTALILPAPSAIVAPSLSFYLHLLLPHPGFIDDELFLFEPGRTFLLVLEGDYNKDIDSEKDKNKDFKMKSLVVETHVVESNDLLPKLLDNDSTLLEESSEIATLSSSSFGNQDKGCLGL
nr:hypothetical protein [Tanacetum cinerariifolium]